MTEWRRRANNFYWGVVVPAFAEQLYTDVQHRQVHGYITEELLPTGDDPHTTDRQGGSISVTGMSDEAFAKFLWRATVWAALEGIELGEPNGEV